MAYIGAEPVPGQNREVDDISSGFNGNATAFTLQVNSVNVSPESAKNILINLGGVLQNPDTDYTINASTLTFTTAPASGLSFFGLILGAGINTATVADGAITTAKLASDAVGANQLANTSVTAGSYTTADITVDAQGRVTAAANGTIATAEIADGAVNNAKVNASAAIAGTKISPDFGSQNIVTTGTLGVGTTTIASTGATPAIIQRTSSTGNVNLEFKNDTSSMFCGLTSSATGFAIDDDNDLGTGPMFFVKRSDGNVGIGTTSPGSLLSLNHATNPAIQFQDSGTKVASINAEGSETNIASFEGKALVFATSTGSSFSERMRIDTSGNVVIGGTSATKRFHVDGPSTATDEIVAKFKGGAGNDCSAAIALVAGYSSTASDTEGHVLIKALRNGSGNTPHMTFFTNNTERMRIDSGGKVMINTTSQINAGLVNVAFNGGSFCAFALKSTNSGSADNFRFFNSAGTQVGSITHNNSTSAYNTSSDYRLKENVTAISDGITRLKTLKPYRFNFIKTPDTTVDGFLAHEVTAVPEAITGTKDEVDSDNNPVYQGIDQSKLTPLLTAALQEAITKIETLEAKVAALEAA